MAFTEGRLVGRRAIVTGAAGGIGRAFAERFLAEGAQVAILDIDIELAERTVAELSDRGILFAVHCDVSDEESVKDAVTQAVSELAGLDILVNNAGLFRERLEQDHSSVNLRRLVDTNLLSLWYVTATASPHLVKSNHGRVINISSTAAFNYDYRGPRDEFPGLRSFAYQWTKYGVNGLTRYSAGQLGHWGVTVNSIAPGPTHSATFDETVDQKIIREHEVNTPIKGQLQPSDMAGIGAFLASDEARYLTGQVLVVDGGRTIPN